MVLDLSSDPHEDNNLTYTDLTDGRILGVDLKIIGEYQQSIQKYPNIKVGEDFKAIRNEYKSE
jgi:hypothetical protein